QIYCLSRLPLFPYTTLFRSEKSTAELLGVDSYDLLTEIASKIPAGADGLLFHPYLGGERAPIWDANARGSFFGLTHNHTRAHMVDRKSTSLNSSHVSMSYAV